MNEQTNEETPTPKKRLPAAVKKRIAELETGYALAISNSETASATRLRTRIERLEQGLSEDPPEDEDAAPVEETKGELGKGYEIGPEGTRELTAEETAALHAAQPCELDANGIADEAKTPKRSFSAEVTSLLANGEPEWEWDTSEEVIDIKLTPEDGLDLLRANGADEEAKAAVDRAIDTMKADLKEKKAESESIAARMKSRNLSGARGVQSRKANWKGGTCFSLNTARYLDPITGRVVLERALRQDERQVELPLPQPKSSDDRQLGLGDVDPTDMNDPETLLAAAQAGEASPSNATLENEEAEDEADDQDGNEEEDGEDEA